MLVYISDADLDSRSNNFSLLLNESENEREIQCKKEKSLYIGWEFKVDREFNLRVKRNHFPS